MFSQLVTTRIQRRNSRAHLTARWLLWDTSLQLLDVTITFALVAALNEREIAAINASLGEELKRSKDELASLVSRVGALSSKGRLLLTSLSELSSTEAASAFFKDMAAAATVRLFASPGNCYHSFSHLSYICRM